MSEKLYRVSWTVLVRQDTKQAAVDAAMRAIIAGEAKGRATRFFNLTPKWNPEQKKLSAEVAKTVALAQFGLFGYMGLTGKTDGPILNLMLLAGSSLVFGLLMYIALAILDTEDHL